MFDNDVLANVREKARGFVRNGNPDWVGYDEFLYSLLPEGSKVVVNTETGEKLDDMVITSKYVLAAKQAFNEYLNEISNRRGVDHRGYFFNVFRDFHKSLEGRLTNNQRTKLMQLMLCIQFEDDPLSRFGKPMTTADIAEYLEVSINTARNKLLNVLCYKSETMNIEPVLIKKRIGREYYYYFNKKGVYMGPLQGKSEFVKLFTKKLDEVIKKIQRIEVRKQKRRSKEKGSIKSEKRTSAIGVLHAIIPYFHYQTYYLVKEPTVNILRPGETVNQARERDQNERKRQHKLLPLAQLCRIVTKNENGNESSMNFQLIQDHIDTLQQAKALIYQKTGGKLAIKIHPYLMFSSKGDGRDEYTKHVLNDFGEIHENKA